jgi:hypothetical protein
MKFQCRTLFDITATGITGHYRSVRLPMTDWAGNTIVTEDQWNRARNQQRNWETLTQIVSLRTQLFDLTDPVQDQDSWSFEFSVESASVFGSADDPTKVLIQDSHNVPMLNKEFGSTR